MLFPLQNTGNEKNLKKVENFGKKEKKRRSGKKVNQKISFSDKIRISFGKWKKRIYMIFRDSRKFLFERDAQIR